MSGCCLQCSLTMCLEVFYWNTMTCPAWPIVAWNCLYGLETDQSYFDQWVSVGWADTRYPVHLSFTGQWTLLNPPNDLWHWSGVSPHKPVLVGRLNLWLCVSSGWHTHAATCIAVKSRFMALALPYWNVPWRITALHRKGITLRRTFSLHEALLTPAAFSAQFTDTVCGWYSRIDWHTAGFLHSLTCCLSQLGLGELD